MSNKQKVSRRRLLRDGAAAAAAGAALLAQTGAALGQPPAAVAQRRFKAWISRGEGPGRTTLQDATLRPIAGRQVLVRTEATNLCYTLVPAVLGLAPPPVAAPQAPPVAGALAGPPSRRRRHRRSRRARRSPRASRRPRLRFRHAALRRVLPVPARALRHVPILERDRR